MPAPESVSDGGRAATRSSTLRLIHGCGRIACRYRAIAVLPELEPPLSTMTWTDMPPIIPIGRT